jgi:hypothetical protein
MAARIAAVAREIEFVLACRITPHVRGHLTRVAVAALVRAKGEDSATPDRLVEASNIKLLAQ